MLIKKKENLYENFLNYIDLESVRDAFNLIVGAAAVLPKLDCYPENKGEIQGFRFYTDDKEQPFSFIINKNSLLFYLRQPAINSKKFNYDKLSNEFHEVNENPKGEWTIKIKNRDDAIKLCEKVLSSW